MNMAKKSYARYFIIRGNHALWNGDPAVSGSQFRQVVITSNEWNSTEGTFQVYAIEGTGRGIVGAELSVLLEPTVLFDGDFQGLDAAGEKFERIVNEAQAQGFRSISLIDEQKFQSKLRGNSH
jgi:hypothetical protein